MYEKQAQFVKKHLKNRKKFKEKQQYYKKKATKKKTERSRFRKNSATFPVLGWKHQSSHPGKMVLSTVAEPGGENSATDGMPSTTDGAWDYCQRTTDSKEGGGKYRCKTSVLHAYLDRDGAFLGCGEAAQAPDSIAKEIATAVVAQHNDEHHCEEKHTFHHEFILHGSHYSTYDTCQTKNTEAGHYRLCLLEPFSFTPQQIAEESNGDWYERHDENIKKHSKCIDLDLLASKPQHKQRCDNRGKECRNGGHAYREGDVALAKVGHDIARHSSRTATNKDDTHNDWFRHSDAKETNTHCERPCDEGHETELGTGADENIERA